MNPKVYQGVNMASGRKGSNEPAPEGLGAIVVELVPKIKFRAGGQWHELTLEEARRIRDNLNSALITTE